MKKIIYFLVLAFIFSFCFSLESTVNAINIVPNEKNYGSLKVKNKYKIGTTAKYKHGIRVTVNGISVEKGIPKQFNLTKEKSDIINCSSIIKANITVQNKSKGQQPIFRLVDFEIVPTKIKRNPPLPIIGSDINDNSILEKGGTFESEDSVASNLVVPANYNKTFNNYYEIEYYKISKEKIKKLVFNYGTAYWAIELNIPKN
ncbi:MAG: hypothetical protein ABF483_07020 [Liquorilactobacillus nagelii]|jgi:hypothetical protein|uniref:DUF3324 domain-containing protein n=1 Tax=Liquorilactobacillus nagelii TaxID=82688 RepID=A0A3Q8CCT6_9LACO|nr:hypothetical protein [Liquorilactobacillus nagelii]AUJ32682.1 hypothetical protein BSQ50_09145 [Liquorilactobacillus nagelii]MCC7616896.1 hypothetical protein [Liquorilactobacillus nagelii]MCP9315681.1 hypothetical protein [Liquorilactobacillus nagelii]